MLVIAGVSSACWYIGLNPMLLCRGNKEAIVGRCVRRAEVGSRYALNSRPHRQFLGLQSLRGHAARCGLGQSVPLVGAVLWNNEVQGSFQRMTPSRGLPSARAHPKSQLFPCRAFP